MLEPYIFSSRSNRVVSSVRGGRRTGTRSLDPEGLTSFCGGSFGVESGFSDGSVSVSLLLEDSESELSSSVGDFVSGTSAGGVFVSFGAGFDIGVFADLAGFSSFLPTDRTVGGSCIGSPANIAFLPFNIGIQQT